MKAPHRPSAVKPRILKDGAIADRLGMHVSTFREKRAHLLKQGFPAYDELLRGTDAKAVETWLDRRAGISTAALTDADAALQEFRASRAY